MVLARKALMCAIWRALSTAIVPSLASLRTRLRRMMLP